MKTVRQQRGPGMNKGLKKPRKQPGEPKPYVMPREMKKALQASGSYLPDTAAGKPRRARKKNPLPGLV